MYVPLVIVGLSRPSPFTLCACVSSNCQVTLPPTFTDTVFGEKARFLASTVADALGGAAVVVGGDVDALLPPPPHAPASATARAVADAVVAKRLMTAILSAAPGRHRIGQNAVMLTEGSPAPPFELSDQRGDRVSLADRVST